MGRNLSTAEVSRILGMRESRVRELVRAGLCRPGRHGHAYTFSFQDLVVLRAAQGLLEKRVPPARVRRALAALAAQLPAGRPLSGLRVYADGPDVVVRDGDAAWVPETGQTVLAFGTDELAARVDAVQSAGAAEAADRDAPREAAERAFERALALEDEDPKAAAAAYARAIELDPDLVDAYVNLGRIEHQAGYAGDASRFYHLALERSPDDPVIHYNLALALEDARGAEAAVAHYERAIDLDPAFADAHYNLAGLYEQLGRGADAIRHYQAYKKLTQT